MSNSSGSSNESPPSPDGNDSPSGGNESSPPDYSTLLDGKTQGDSPQEGNNNSPPSESSPPPPSSDSSPPSEGGDNSSPPDSSNSSPPPESDNGSSSSSPPSPPSDSKSSPSPSESENYSPPPESKDSSSSPPPPSEEGNEESPPPPAGQKSKPSPPPPQEGSLPPSQSQSSPPPPQESTFPPSGSGSPPRSNSSPSPPPPKSSEAYPPPNGDSALSPPSERGSPPLQRSPPDAISPPQSRDSPRMPSRDNSSPSNDDTPSSPSSHESPKLNPSSKESNSHQSSSESNSSAGSSSTHVVGAVVGVVVIFLIAIFFVVARRKKSRKHAHYIPPPDSFTARTDGYYYGPQHQIGIPGNSQEYYSGPPPMGFAPGNTLESVRGNAINTNGPESGMLGGSKSCFSYEELMEITHGFSRENILGEGGFGCVYKGWLSDGRLVAVKQLKVGSGQGEREFRAEVDIISRVHHRHLVSLVGYCIADNQRLLVYEFVPNKTLEYHLHGEGLPVMEWPKRLSIAIGSARGLAYLHEDCHPKIIHRDIKSANILVDDSFEAQVADFGLAKLSTDTYTHVSTRVMGTFGYMAPEYASSGKLTDRSDVFSFGVVLLEIVTGRKPVDQSRPMGDESLVEWARPLLMCALQTGDISQLVDPRLENKYVESEMFRVIEAAAACIRHSAPKRPRMVQVLRSLDSEGDMPDLSNGVKYGQSTVFESRQYSSDIQKFRNLAFGDDISEYDAYSGEFGSREMPRRPPHPGMSGDMSSAEYTSGESETRAINPRGSQWR